MGAARSGCYPDPLTGTVTAPSESTLRRALAKVKAAELQRLTSQWVQATARALRADTDTDTDGGAGQGTTDGGRRLAGVAIDGKSVRGAAAGGGTRPHLLSAVIHDGSIVLAQRQIPDKGSEITELAPLVAELDLVGKVVTVDALCRLPDYAEHRGERAGQRGYGCWVVGIIRAVTSFIMGQARQCARVWSAKTLVTAMCSLLRFVHVEGLIPAPLVGGVPAVAGWRLSAWRTQMEKPPDHQPGLCRPPTRLKPCGPARSPRRLA